MSIWALFLLILVLVPLLYLYAVLPSLRFKKRALMPSGLYAHRGLYDNIGGVPENSMAAFRAAAEQGYRIELDVQRTLDGKVIVFHDRSTGRMCGEDLTVCDHTWEELSHLQLIHTEEHIPLLADVLREIDVPLLIDIKNPTTKKSSKSQTAKVARCVRRLISGKEQSVLIQSADPRVLFWFRLHEPSFLRGQIRPDKFAVRDTHCAHDVRHRFRLRKPRIGARLQSFALRHSLLNFLSRPDFITMDFHQEEDLALLLSDRVLRTPMAACCVKNQDQLNYCRDTLYNIQIFDSFLAE